MRLILCLLQFGQTPLYTACSKGHDKIVQALLDHSVEVDVQDKVSDISCIHVNLCNTTEVNEATLVRQEISKNDVYILSLLSYDFNQYQYNISPCNKSYSLSMRGIISSVLTRTLNLPSFKSTMSQINPRH